MASREAAVNVAIYVGVFLIGIGFGVGLSIWMFLEMGQWPTR